MTHLLSLLYSVTSGKPLTPGKSATRSYLRQGNSGRLPLALTPTLTLDGTHFSLTLRSISITYLKIIGLLSGLILSAALAAPAIAQTPETVQPLVQQPSEAGTALTGTVRVEGRDEAHQANHQLMAADFSGRVFTGQTGTGGYVLLADIPAGTYTLVASSPGFLHATCDNVVHQGGTTQLQPVTLLAGDLDNSGAIDVVDVVMLGAAFDLTDPAEIANLNGDSIVDVLDLILLAANFDRTATAHPWLCQ